MTRRAKATKPGPQQWQQYTDRTGFCVGCGYYHAVHNSHRDDCTAPKIDQENT